MEAPGDENADFARPFQQLDILQRGGSLIDQLQYIVMHALDARLQPPDAGGSDDHQVIALQVRLGLEKQGVGIVACETGRPVFTSRMRTSC